MLRFVVRLIFADGFKEVVVLLLVCIFGLGFGRETPGSCAFDGVQVTPGVEIGAAFGAEDVLGDRGPAAGDLAALTEHPAAIGVLEFDEMVVEDLPVPFGVSDLAAAHPLGAYR